MKVKDLSQELQKEILSYIPAHRVHRFEMKKTRKMTCLNSSRIFHFCYFYPRTLCVKCSKLKAYHILGYGYYTMS